MAECIRTLGIDPGTRLTGYGIVEQLGRASRLLHIDNGVIIPQDTFSFADKLYYIGDKIRALITEFKPHVCSIERLFYAKNVQSALKLSHARGVAMMMAAQHGLPVFEYTALQIKQASVGHGHADKIQVQEMVRMILGLKEVAQEDASDALAAAICHLQYAHSPVALITQLEQQTKKRRHKKNTVGWLSK